jgi:hypothetical protein
MISRRRIKLAVASCTVVVLGGLALTPIASSALRVRPTPPPVVQPVDPVDGEVSVASDDAASGPSRGGQSTSGTRWT